MATLPLTNNSEESFSIVISETLYNMRQLWNAFGFWTLDIKDADNVPLITGIRLLAQVQLTAMYPSIPFDLYSAATTDPERYTLDTFNLEVTAKDV